MWAWEVGAREVGARVGVSVDGGDVSLGVCSCVPRALACVLQCVLQCVLWCVLQRVLWCVLQ